jgi:HSP90 family molecular chaperone
MYNERVHFSKEDIGAAILPILTSGLYQDILDTLREYIQNSIDAQCDEIALSIDPDVVSVNDNGVGMTLIEAKRADAIPNFV